MINIDVHIFFSSCNIKVSVHRVYVCLKVATLHHTAKGSIGTEIFLYTLFASLPKGYCMSGSVLGLLIQRRSTPGEAPRWGLLSALRPSTINRIKLTLVNFRDLTRIGVSATSSPTSCQIGNDTMYFVVTCGVNYCNVSYVRSTRGEPGDLQHGRLDLLI